MSTNSATLSLVDRIVADLQKHGPSRRAEIARRIGSPANSLYWALARNPDLFRQVPGLAKNSRAWALVERKILSDESIAVIKPNESIGGTVDHAKGFTEAEAIFLREIARWRQAHRVNFVRPVDCLRILVAMGWAFVPGVGNGGAMQKE